MDIVRSVDDLLTVLMSFFLSHTSTFSVAASPVAAITGMIIVVVFSDVIPPSVLTGSRDLSRLFVFYCIIK